MRTMMSDLSPELVEEILSRVPLTSLRAVRLTSKQWNTLSKDRIVCKARSKYQFLGFMMMSSRACSLRFEGGSDFASVGKLGKLHEFKISQIFHSGGLLLCVTSDRKKLVVWNPYLDQIRITEPRNSCSGNKYGLGYDSSGRYKILRFLDCFYVNFYKQMEEYEIYDFESNSWRNLDITPDCDIWSSRRGVSLKGNTYWIGQDKIKSKEEAWELEDLPDDFLVCFDFTREIFGSRLKLPFKYYVKKTGYLSCVREEQLAVMFQYWDSNKMEIWLTTKIEPEYVSWSKFLLFDMTPSLGIQRAVEHGSFFIDQEKQVAMLLDLGIPQDNKTPRRNIVFIIGQDGCYKEVDLCESSCRPIVCPYVPSLVHIKQTARGKRKRALLKKKKKKNEKGKKRLN